MKELNIDKDPQKTHSAPNIPNLEVAKFTKYLDSLDVFATAHPEVFALDSSLRNSINTNELEIINRALTVFY